MATAEVESELCRCKIVTHEIHKTYSQREISKMETCRKCCETSAKFTVGQLLKICKQDPDCIINLYKSSTSSEKCLPELTCEPKPTVEEVQTEPPKQVEKATSAAINLGDSKYHYLMVDGSTNIAVPYDSETMSIDSKTWICEKITDKDGELTYVCKKIQTQEIQELTSKEMEPVAEKSSTKVVFASDTRTRDSFASINSRRMAKKRSISIMLTDTRKSIHTFFSNLRRRSRTSRDRKTKKLAFDDEPSVILLRRSHSMPTTKERWNSIDYEMSFLKFVVQEQKDQASCEESISMVVPTITSGGICRPVVRLFNAIKAKLRRKRKEDRQQSTHVIKVVYMDDDEMSIRRSIVMRHTDALTM